MSEGEAPEPSPVEGPPTGHRHRLRDLDALGRTVAVLLALGLLLAPIRAVLVELDRWTPQADNALIELRATDAGTRRTPLVGQPSTSGFYGSAEREHVAHPGPAGFVVLAPGLRLLGSPEGILLTTAVVTGVSVLLTAWVVLRQAGPAMGAVAAILLALAMWSAGGAGMLDPISSNFGRFPLLACVVLVWALTTGDLRLAPLAAGTWSFAAQQHLSVAPVALVVGLVGLVTLTAVVVGRARKGGWTSVRTTVPWLGGAAVVGLLMWSPVLVEQVRDDPGNLTVFVDYAGDGGRENVGFGAAPGVLAQVGGLPPLLGRSSVQGWDLLVRPSMVASLIAVASAAVLLAGAWSVRRREPRLSALVAMMALLALAGIVNVAHMPASLERGRLSFYHWAFALSFVQILALVWLARVVAAHREVRPVRPRLPAAWRGAAGGAAVIAVVAVALVPLTLDRDTDRLIQYLPRTTVDRLVEDVVASPAGADRDEPALVLVEGVDEYYGVGDTLTVRLRAAGLDARFPPRSQGYVHGAHRIDPCDVDRAVVIGLGSGRRVPLPGRRIADHLVAASLDLGAFDRLVLQARGEPVELGADLQAALAGLGREQGELRGASLVFGLSERPDVVLRSRSVTEMLAEHPPESPALDRSDLAAWRDSVPEDIESLPATHITIHLLDRPQLHEHRPDLVTDCA